MADISNFMSSSGSFIKASEHSMDETVTIVSVEEGTDYNQNPCLNVVINDERKIQLKKRNIKELADLFGNETDEWVGKEVGLTLTQVEYNGTEYPGFKFVASDDLPF